MYPTLFTIRGFEITSFGVLVATAALVGIWILQSELRRSHLPASAADAAIAGVLGGLAGAKLIWAIEFSRSAPFAELLFSRGGLSWFGGLLGGVGTGLWVLRRQHVRALPVLAAAAPALAIGHAIGRVGCFMVGDDYGRPSSLPWAVAFPEGRPPTFERVHPTQLYEAVALVIVALVLRTLRRRDASDRVVFGLYLVLAGSIRFGIEFVRINAKIVGPFTLAQTIAFAVACVGLALLLRRRRVVPATGSARTRG
jgi:phosphatidylglycerol:prolipoprotein diacylglycerol transferase